MPAQGLVITATSTPTVVAGSLTAGSTPPTHGYIRVRVKSLSGSVYLGDSGVTTAGYPFSSGDSPIDVTLLQGETLWVASSSGASPTIGVLRLNETT